MAGKISWGPMAWALFTMLSCQSPALQEVRADGSATPATPSQKPTGVDQDLISPATSPPQTPQNLQLQAVISRQVHPSAKIVSLEDLNPPTRGDFLKIAPDGSPGLIIADFNGDGITDYAALVRFPQRNHVGEWLVIFLGTKEGSFRLRLLEKYDAFHDDVYITSEEPGDVKVASSARPFKLRLPGITRIHPARRMTIFYWHNGRFQRLLKQPAPSLASRLPSP